MPAHTPTGLPYPLPGDQVAALPATLRELAELISTNVQPTGIIAPFAGDTPPQGWLLCDGAEYAQAALPDLFAVVSTRYNIGGEAAGRFRVPDLRGRTVIGPGGDGSAANDVARQLGQRGGDTRLQAHNHGGTTGTTNTDHTHNQTNALGPAGGFTGSSGVAGIADPNGQPSSSTTAGQNGNNSHNHTIANDGAGTAANMPPFLVASYIIRT